MVGVVRSGVAVASAWVVATSLQGCGSKPKPGPTPAPTPTPTPSPTTWKLAPIVVTDSHMYNSKTGEPFKAKGLGFPNLGEDVDERIKVLKRVKELGPNLNVVRLYTLPSCATNSDCMKPFMEEADKLGVYVIVPATGTTTGWLPGEEKSCKPDTAEGCYKSGNVLAFGQNVIQRFNYPNTLAIAVGNEFDMLMYKFMPVLKAYTRDLKAHMKFCNEADKSPTKGKMRNIPLMYASSDDRGDPVVMPKADYLFCDSQDTSIDIFGLNIERWCDDKAGKIAYDGLHKLVQERKYPGAYFMSEMGCSKTNVVGGNRHWTQLRDFFTNYPAFDGYAAYTYFGNKDFDMFDGETSTAKEFPDGENFFNAMKASGKEPKADKTPSTRPKCPEKIRDVHMTSFKDIKAYDTGDAGLATSCPAPYEKAEEAEPNPREVIV